MLIRSRPKHDLSENQVTPESVYLNRRRLLQTLGIAGASLPVAASAQRSFWDRLFGGDSEDAYSDKGVDYGVHRPQPIEHVNLQSPKPDLPLTPKSKSVTYNNFYEFGTQKTDPANRSKGYVPKPWTLEIAGEVEKPLTIDVWELIHATRLEERIYRLRCVEAWSMNIPWLGLELGSILKRAQPTSRAKFVAFQTVYAPDHMPGQSRRHMGGSTSPAIRIISP